MAKIERRIPATERYGYYSIFADTIEEINTIEAQIEKTMADKKNPAKKDEWKPFE